MKKLLTILLFSFASLFAQDITGDGSLGDPYVIYTPSNMDSVRNLEGDGSKYFLLNNDIDLGAYTNWLPIGTEANPFKGAFDGGGYTITNLTIDTTYTTGSFLTHGLFGKGQIYDLNRYFVKNLTLDTVNIMIYSEYSSGWNAYIGALLGEFDGGSSNDYQFENITILNLDMNVTFVMGVSGSSQWAIGGMIGHASVAEIAKVYVQGDVIVTCLSGTAVIPFVDGVGGITGTNRNGIAEAAFIGNVSFLTPGNATLLGVGGITGFFDASATVDSLVDCYVHINKMVGGYSMGGIVGYNRGESQVRVRRTYAVIDTFSADTGTAEDSTDRDGYLVGYSESTGPVWTSNYADTERVSFDYDGKLGFLNDDRTLVSYEEVGAPPDSAAKTTAEMMTQSTFVDWDFINTWQIQGGYPFLRASPLTLNLSAPAGGEVMTFPDTLWITWQGGSTADTILVYYSLDNGFTYTLSEIEAAVTDTFFIPTGLSSSQFKIRITTTDSVLISTSGTFEYIGSISVTILEPLNVTGINNDGTYADSIVVASVLADAVNLYYSIDDTLNWITLAENILQPDVQDTVFWYWNPVPQVTGDIWLKAATEVDTVKYGPFDSTIVEIGSQRPSTPTICWAATNAQWSIFRNFELDVSCGWSSPDLIHYSIVIDDYAEAYTTLSVTCAQPCPSPVYPNNGSVFLYTGGGDTTETFFQDFYEEKGSSVTYNQRLYYIADSTLYMNDLRNSIDSIALKDLSQYYYAVSGQGWSSAPTLSIYNVQWSKIVTDTLAVNADFESFNDAFFIPRLVISGHGAPNGIVPGVTYDLLSSPPSGEYAQDVQLGYSDLGYTRYFFRGIHPKIDKDR